MNLKNIVVINDRAENCIKDFREYFDYATARAVSNLPILLELLTPFVKVKGHADNKYNNMCDELARKEILKII